MPLSRILTFKGIHYLVTRYGPARLRSLAFDEKYRTGSWNFVGDSSAELSQTVRRYLNSGQLLMIGCGGASLLQNLNDSDFTSVLGLDISSEALRLASRFASEKVSFEHGDMRTFQSERLFDVILFSESLYYIPVKEARECLDRLRPRISANGAFIVTVAEPERYAELLKMIRDNFTMLEDNSFPHSHSRVLVFRGPP
jgi:2-polyprenyl-3-methyl-5-hydroxy-6-metoxy-1,4-benzoquinol methylase